MTHQLDSGKGVQALEDEIDVGRSELLPRDLKGVLERPFSFSNPY
jgi:hypothetical protein